MRRSETTRRSHSARDHLLREATTAGRNGEVASAPRQAALPVALVDEIRGVPFFPTSPSPTVNFLHEQLSAMSI